MSTRVSRTRRLALLTNLYPPDVLGGYELLARDVAAMLAERGHDVHVLTTGADAADANVTRTLQLSRPFGTAPRADRWRHHRAAAHNARATRAFLTAHGPFDGVIVMSLRRLGLAPLRAFRKAGVPTVVTVNDDWPVAYALPAGMPQWRKRIESIVSAPKILQPDDVERVVYLSNAVRDVVRRSGAPLPEGSQQFQGVDRRLFRPAARETRALGPQRLLFSGRLHQSKGPEFVIDALAALRREGREIELVFAGAAHDAAYDAELRARAERMGVAADIRWLGHVDRAALPAVYQSADVCVFISTLAHEGQGLTYLEAMACGVPVVAWPSGGAAEFLDQFPVARRAAAITGDALAAEIGALLDSPHDAARLRNDALRMIETHASLDVYVSALESAIA